MPTYVALLRAINVGVANRLKMADLREALDGLDLESVRTLLQSGNVVFSSTSRSAAKLEARLEERVREKLGLDSDCFVRSSADWRELVRANPFPREAKREPSKLLAIALKKRPTAAAVSALQSSIEGPERLRAHGRQLYAFYPNGTAKSRLTIARIESALQTRATGRGWNTVLKLEETAGR
jgi:uncharacterized protein (DUF1697 family)